MILIASVAHEKVLTFLRTSVPCTQTETHVPSKRVVAFHRNSRKLYNVNIFRMSGPTHMQILHFTYPVTASHPGSRDCQSCSAGVK